MSDEENKIPEPGETHRVVDATLKAVGASMSKTGFCVILVFDTATLDEFGSEGLPAQLTLGINLGEAKFLVEGVSATLSDIDEIVQGN